MLKDLILGEVVLEEAGQSQLDQLPAERPTVVAPDEEAVMRDLHGDGAEPFADAPGGDVAEGGAEEAPPVEAAVVIEPPVLGGDESRADVRGHDRQRHVHAAHVLEMAKEPAVPVED